MWEKFYDIHIIFLVFIKVLCNFKQIKLKLARTRQNLSFLRSLESLGPPPSKELSEIWRTGTLTFLWKIRNAELIASGKKSQNCRAHCFCETKSELQNSLLLWKKSELQSSLLLWKEIKTAGLIAFVKKKSELQNSLLLWKKVRTAEYCCWEQSELLDSFSHWDSVKTSRSS